MKRSLLLFALVEFVALAVMAASPPRLDVKIVNRQDNESDYTYQIPGRATSSSTANASCYAGSTNVNCLGSGQTNTVITAPQSVYMHLTGATLTLLLPDGRMAVVNCESKFQERFAGRGNRRSCRVPLVDGVGAEFKGSGAKLFWPVSLDGRKLESETYRVLAVIPATAQKQSASSGNSKPNPN